VFLIKLFLIRFCVCFTFIWQYFNKFSLYFQNKMVKLNGDFLRERLNIRNIQDQVNICLGSKDIDEIEPTLFHNCQRLENLNLSWNKLITLDRNLFVHCTNLRELGLWSNHINEIEPTLFNNCHMLEILVLSSNRLKALDRNLFVNCTNLWPILAFSWSVGTGLDSLYLFGLPSQLSFEIFDIDFRGIDFSWTWRFFSKRKGSFKYCMKSVGAILLY
jgi:Leucine-rich repeat (LRR) protein